MEMMEMAENLASDQERDIEISLNQKQASRNPKGGTITLPFIIGTHQSFQTLLVINIIDADES